MVKMLFEATINVTQDQIPEVIANLQAVAAKQARPQKSREEVPGEFIYKHQIVEYFENLGYDELNAKKHAGPIWALLTDHSKHKILKPLGLDYLVVCRECGLIYGSCRCGAYGFLGRDDWIYWSGEAHGDHHWKVGRQSIIDNQQKVEVKGIPKWGPVRHQNMRKWVDQL